MAVGFKVATWQIRSSGFFKLQMLEADYQNQHVLDLNDSGGYVSYVGLADNVGPSCTKLLNLDISWGWRGTPWSTAKNPGGRLS